MLHRVVRNKLLWLPVGVAAVALIVVLAPAGSNAAGALLSKGRPATSTSAYRGCPASAANDGDLSTRWMALSGAYPQRWTVDLGSRRALGLVTVHWQRANQRVYRYRIVASNDRQQWTTLKDRARNSTIGTTYDTVSGAYRYLRVKVLSSTYGWAQIYEVEVFAPNTAAPPLTPTPTAPAVPSTTPVPTPTPTVTFSTPAATPTPTLTFAPAPTPQPTPTAPTASGQTVTVAGTTATALDTAIAAAKAKGTGTTVVFPAGSYSHATLTWPNGINLRGAGIGSTRLNFALAFGSNSRIEDATMGATQSTAFSFVNGAHDSVLEDVRFRGRGFSLWQATDFTSDWSDGVRNQYANFHDMTFTRAEFEYTNDSDGDLWSIWWDSRSGGGRVYDVTWQDCAFGVKNSTGAVGQGRVGFIMQPSPPEHASDGPRPTNGAVDYGFDWSKVTHGAGLAADASADYGFRMTGSSFVGPASFVSMNACDYLRSWAMTTYRIPASSPGNVTQTMRDAAPDRITSKGWYVADNWFSRDLRFENGRDVTISNSPDNQGAGAYNVPAVVKTHDAQLYGF